LEKSKATRPGEVKSFPCKDEKVSETGLNGTAASDTDRREEFCPSSDKIKVPRELAPATGRTIIPGIATKEVGTEVGSGVGEGDGAIVGEGDGTMRGTGVGESDGTRVGTGVGTAVGDGVGT